MEGSKKRDEEMNLYKEQVQALTAELLTERKEHQKTAQMLGAKNDRLKTLEKQVKEGKQSP